jgi:hypothetical protein
MTLDLRTVQVECYESSVFVDTVPDGLVVADVAVAWLTTTGTAVATTVCDALDELDVV